MATAPRLTPAQWIAVGGGLALAFSLLALPWFAVTVDGFVQPGSDGAAFELLGGIDVVLLIAAMVPLVAPALAGELARKLVVAAGAIAVGLTIYVIVAPPEPDVVAVASLESSADLSLEARGGALVGLLAAVAIAAGGALMIGAGPQLLPQPTPAPTSEPEAGAAPVAAVPKRVTAPAPVAGPVASLTPAPEPRRKPQPTRKPKAPQRATPKPKPKPKPKAAGKARAKPKAAAKRKTKAGPRPKPRPRAAPRPIPKQAGLLSLKTASAEDLAGIGFSSTQANRIVRYRDEEAIVTTVADLKRVPGIAKPVLAELIKRLED